MSTYRNSYRTLDTHDLAEEKTELEEMATYCVHCDEEVEVTPDGLDHVLTDSAVCGDGPTRAQWSLDAEGEARLKELESLSDSLGGLPFNGEVVLDDDFQEYVEENADDLMEIPEHLRGYIDYEIMANDWRVDWSSVEFDGQGWLYR